MRIKAKYILIVATFLMCGCTKQEKLATFNMYENDGKCFARIIGVGTIEVDGVINLDSLKAGDKINVHYNGLFDDESNAGWIYDGRATK